MPTLSVVMAALSYGCPHINSGLPPPLRHPLIQASTPAAGQYHTVTDSETLPSIAEAYNADPQQLAEVNNLRPPYVVQGNTKLFIPGGHEQDSIEEDHRAGQEPAAVKDFAGLISWPVEGKIISEFGVKGGVQHNGILIEAAEGFPVKAAENGKVGHVGSIPGYGNVVLIEHANRLVTVYAHLKEIKTRTGRLVSRGDCIGTVGSSGRATSPCLYFEVRSRTKPRNPLFFLRRNAQQGSQSGNLSQRTPPIELMYWMRSIFPLTHHRLKPFVIHLLAAKLTLASNFCGPVCFIHDKK